MRFGPSRQFTGAHYYSRNGLVTGNDLCSPKIAAVSVISGMDARILPLLYGVAGLRIVIDIGFINRGDCRRLYGQQDQRGCSA